MEVLLARNLKQLVASVFKPKTVNLRKQRRAQKAAKRRVQKKYIKQLSRLTGQYPTPTKSKPLPIMMQKDAIKQLLVLRTENQRLTKRVTELNQQLAARAA
jgi:hypothetical protein